MASDKGFDNYPAGVSERDFDDTAELGRYTLRRDREFFEHLRELEWEDQRAEEDSARKEN